MASYLDRVLALAATGDLDEPDADDLGGDYGDKYDDLPPESDLDLDGAADYLEKQSPWYARVAGGESPGDPYDEILSAGLTARTAEASTVPQPTRPPGGPGLFHIKGRELPPYVQHLYKHLVGKYGPHRAYGVAIGIVKKWAAGINPGGKGKGHKVHSDVQAAAAKNVAQWEKDKADAHLHHEGHKVAATGTDLAAVLALASVRGYEREERGKLEHVGPSVRAVHGWILPGVPGEDEDKRAANAGRAAAGVLKRAKRQNMSVGMGLGVAGGSNDIERPVADALIRAARSGKDHYVIPTALGLQASEMPTSHSSGYIRVEPGGRVTKLERRNSASPLTHRATLSDHSVSLILDRQLSKAKTYEPLAAKPKVTKADPDIVPRSVVARLVKDIKKTPELQTPAYKQRAAEVADKSGVGDLIPDEWRLAAPAAWPSGKPYSQSFLPSGPTTQLLQGDQRAPGSAIRSAPGARPVLAGGGRLRQAPVATVSASPPLPPGVTLPTPDEIRALIPRIADSPQPDQTHDEALRLRLETAAHKLSTGDNVGTLNLLRIAQGDAAALYRDAVNANKPNVAGIFAWQATSTPPAAQTSVRTAMLAGREQADEYKAIATTIAQWIDRFRRAYFHGQYGGLASLRFTSDLDAVLALAGKPPPSPESVHLRQSGNPRECCATCSMWTKKPPDFESGRCSLLERLTGESQVCDDWELRKGALPGASAARALAAPNPHGAAGAVYK